MLHLKFKYTLGFISNKARNKLVLAKMSGGSSPPFKPCTEQGESSPPIGMLTPPTCPQCLRDCGAVQPIVALDLEGREGPALTQKGRGKAGRDRRGGEGARRWGRKQATISDSPSPRVQCRWQFLSPLQLEHSSPRSHR